MKQLSSPKRSNRGVHGSGPSKQLSASTLQTLETQVTCSTHQSRSRTPSPHQQRQARGMDPGGLIVIPRRKLPDATAAATTKKSAKSAAGDKEVKRNELPTTQQQQQRQETALVVASAVVTPPSILTITDDKESSSDKHEKNNNSVHQVKEVALTLYKDSNKSGTSKSTSSTAVGNERVKEDKASEGRHYRAHLWSTSKEGNKRSSSRPRASGTTTSRNDTGIDGNEHHRSNKDDRGRKNKSKLSKSRSSRGNAKESKDAGEDRKNKKSGKTKEQTDKKEDKQPATKKKLSKRKKSKQFNSISGSREAIRSFSKRSGQKSNWKGDGEDGKNKSWKEGTASSNPEKSKSFIKRLGGKFSGKSATVAEDTADEKEVGGTTEISPNTSVGAVAPTEKSLIPSSRGKARGRNQFQQRAASKRDVRSNSPLSPQDIRRRPSLSPDRSMSPQSHSSRGSFYSGSRSPSPSPRRNRRSLSPHSSSRGSSYSGSRSPSPRRRRSLSSHSCSSYSRSRSPSPRRRRSMSSQGSCASGSVSYYSRSRSPSPRRRLTRSVSPPSPRSRSRGGRRFHSRSRMPSPRRMREFGGARRMRSPPPRVNQNRRDSFRSLSPPRGRTSNDFPPMRKQSSFHVMPRQPSFLSRSRSPEPRGGRRQMSAHGNQHHNRVNLGPNRRPQPMSRRRSISSGHHRRGSSSPPLNRQNSDFVPRTKVTPVGTTLRRSTFQNERRITRSPSPPRMRPQSQQRQISDVYKRPVRDESRALVIRGQSPSAEDTSMTSTSALVPGVESQSSRNKPAARRSSQSSESTGVWIDCPEQNDPCDEDLTFSECQGFRDDDSDATYDATHGFPPGPPSGAHSFATYEMPDGPPPASGRLVDLRKLTKPGRKNQGSNQTRSKAADLRRISETVENSTTTFEGSWRNKETAGLAEDHEDANIRQLSLAVQSLVGQGIARKSNNGSIPSRDKKQSPPFVPGPPPRKPLMNMSSSASVSERPRSKSPTFVRNNRSLSGNSRTNIESNGPANHQKAQDNDPPHINRPSPPPPPPFLHRPNDSPMETHQPVASNPSFQNLFEGPSEKNWQQYLTKGKRNTSRQRGSSRSNSPERDSSRGRRASSTGRTSRERSLSAGRKLFGRAPEKLDYNDREVNNVVNNMPFTDNFGDPGIYSGQVNDNGRPNGKGSMKYDNGIFYEGTWTDGGQDEEAATQYARIRGGFTSWGGKGTVAVKSGKTMPWNAHKNDKHDENDTTYVRGMEWVDLNGDAGRYTGEVNNDKVPHGKGMMKYDFGLIAQGEWVYGVLKENPHDRVLSAAELSAKGQGADAMSIMSSLRSLKGGGMSVGPGVGGGMSVGPMMRPPMMLGGGMSVGPGMGSAMSVGPGMSVAQGSTAYSGMPQMMMQPQQMMMIQPQLPPPMMMPQPNNLASQQNAALVAQQNAMAQAMAMYGGQPMNQMPARPPQRLMPMQQQQHTMQGDPPITEIKFS
mmetsp:Transcript_12995/g.26311  ORF Transcript_12995/g.26311 Transcript_12995/m.26311 type:complete len:1467 (-) Transcript_12995:26-4426(-)